MTGVQAPVALAYSRSNDALFVIGAESGTAATEVRVLTPFSRVPESARGRVSAAVQDPINAAVDDRYNRLLLLANPRELVEVEFGKKGNLQRPRIRDVTRLGLKDPQGLAVDPTSSTIFILDASLPRIVRVVPRANGALGGAATSELDLSATGLAGVRGLAFDPASSHLYLRSATTLVELTQVGEVISGRDLTGLGLVNPQALVVAPSGDLTDDPEELSVYVADAGGGGNRGRIAELSLTPLPAVAADFTSTLVNTVDLGALDPPSPDPSGITYVPAGDKLVITDGEVEEIVGGITHFQGANVWELTRSGSIIRTANISKVEPTDTPMTDEPTGITWKPSNGHYFITEDGGKRVYDLNPGPDGSIGTSDDTWTFFRTNIAPNDNLDPEGIAYDTLNDRLFVADGVNREIYQYTTSGTLIGHFDVQQYGVEDPETVDFNPINGTLLVLSNRQSGPIIVETTTSGALLQTTDVSAAGAIKPAGLAYTTASDGSNMARYYIIDRGIDNNSDPDAVDGKLFEMTWEPPTIINPTP